MKKNYKIDFAANTVTVTKTFLHTADTDINSPEFKTLTQLREMGLTIVEKAAPRRKNVHHATYKQMLAYISCVTDAARYLAEFEVVRLASLEKPNPYQYVTGMTAPSPTATTFPSWTRTATLSTSPPPSTKRTPSRKLRRV